MLNTILELKTKLKGGGNAETSESPFTKRLENEANQRHIKHISLSYFDQLALHCEYKDLTRCRFFVVTSKGGSQRWFCRLPLRILESWYDFKRGFLNKFKTN